MRPTDLVLLSNDDGFSSPGLEALRTAFSSAATTIVVAPETEQSATSHSLSLHRPLRVRSVTSGVFAIDGTPADCVYVALHATPLDANGLTATPAESRHVLLPKLPRLVVSGINVGLNLGQDVFYSGTVAAAREAALRGIPSLAVSAHPKADHGAIAALAVQLAEMIIEASESDGKPLLYNVNVPRRWNGKVKTARIGSRIYDQAVEFRADPRGRDYLWLGGVGVRHDDDPGSDTEAYDQGFASLTPLALELTLHRELARAEQIAARYNG
jgi:5'-nucleotidase